MALEDVTLERVEVIEIKEGPRRGDVFRVYYDRNGKHTGTFQVPPGEVLELLKP